MLVFCGSAEMELYLKKIIFFSTGHLLNYALAPYLGHQKPTSQVVVAAASQYLAQVIKEVFNWAYR